MTPSVGATGAAATAAWASRAAISMGGNPGTGTWPASAEVLADADEDLAAEVLRAGVHQDDAAGAARAAVDGAIVVEAAAGQVVGFDMDLQVGAGLPLGEDRHE